MVRRTRIEAVRENPQVVFAPACLSFAQLYGVLALTPPNSKEFRNPLRLKMERESHPMRLFPCLFVLILSSPHLAQAISWLPCPGNSQSVRANYAPDPDGAYCFVPNGSNPIDLADPSVLRIGDTYFAVGTNDDESVANFRIYRSSDLIHWELHGRIFSPDARIDRPGSVPMIGLHAGRRFCDLWAPQLTQIPGDNTQIYLSFTAIEDGAQQTCALQNVGERLGYNSVFRSAVPTEQFLAGQHFWDVVDYGYTSQNAPIAADGSNLRFDGGVSFSRTIPATTSRARIGSQNGRLQYSHGRLYIRGRPRATALGIDGFVYFDPLDQNKPYLLYNWFDTAPGSANFGQQIAAMPLLGDLRRFDFNGSLFPVSHKENSTNRIPLVGSFLNNGRYGANGPLGGGYGVAEGAAVFHYNNRTYVLTSRNTFDGPAYGMYYRFGNPGQKLRDLALPGWANVSTPERVLVQSLERTQAGGPSYGHGEVFIGPQGRPYLVFHKKLPGTLRRILSFKELSFLPDGSIRQLSEAPHASPSATVDSYLVPRPVAPDPVAAVWSPVVGAPLRTNLGMPVLAGSTSHPHAQGLVAEGGAVALSGSGALSSAIHVIPPFAESSPSWIEAPIFSGVLPAAQTLTLHSSAGLAAWSECGDGARVSIEIVDVATQSRYTAASALIPRRAGEVPLVGTLAASRGREIRAFLRVDSLPNNWCDRVAVAPIELRSSAPLPLNTLGWTTSDGVALSYGQAGTGSLGAVVPIPHAPLISGGGVIAGGGTFVHPPYSGGYIEGVSPEIVLPAAGNPQFILQGGMVVAPDCGDGVELLVGALAEDNPTPQWRESLYLPRGSNVRAFSHSLQDLGGKKIRLVLRIRANADAACDHSLWSGAAVITSKD